MALLHEAEEPFSNQFFYQRLAGAQNNIAVPVNTLLTQLIHAKEAQ
ncbi:TPA: hypothetical protein G8N84_003681 [Salmonella enterica]|uniref:Uncharacterized protein n=1 Tax=Salmonella enterica TaxID=28901 RepID=A0A744C5D8_SALER|nr:hypothetical protein [Salmonella enterica subsp. enterica serovar Gaminara]HAF1792436.1 hypothetical protein [Salmonella enterica]HAF2143789.1 hypothetical protein [Salmonella enterica]HAF2399206.1 hypothetical protein [Salmonella enterica]HAF2403576.1 hypothetical protein [Salmonella enterica]